MIVDSQKTFTCASRRQSISIWLEIQGIDTVSLSFVREVADQI
jgi:hypothetical protein